MTTETPQTGSTVPNNSNKSGGAGTITLAKGTASAITMTVADFKCNWW